MAKYTSKLLECLHSKVFEVCLTIFHHDTFSAWSLLKGHTFLNKQAVFSCTRLFRIVWTFCGHQTWKSFAWMQKKTAVKRVKFFNFLWRRSLSYRNQCQKQDLLCKSMDWLLYDRDLRHERVNKRRRISFVAVIMFNLMIRKESQLNSTIISYNGIHLQMTKLNRWQIIF